MAIKSDIWIKEQAEKHGMIEPFVDHQVADGVISYGLSSYGYDMRVGTKFRIPKFEQSQGELILDPKNKSQIAFEDFEGDSLVLKPGQFVLGTSVEYFRIPRQIITIAYGKSTYARSGIFCNITPFEPEWEGFVTLMIANTGEKPAKLYGGEGIAQVLFLESDQSCRVSYADRKGKYQAQKTITHSRV